LAQELYGVGGLTVETRTWYEKGLLMRAVPSFLYSVEDNFKKGSIPKRGGRVSNWRRLELLSVATTALTEGTPPADTQITYSSVNATVDQFGVVIKVSDVAETQSIDPVVMDTIDMLGENLGDSRDIIARNVMTAGTTVQFASTGTSRQNVSSGMNLNYAEIREAVATLEIQNAKPFSDGFWRSVIRPETKRDLFGDSDVLLSIQNAGDRGDSNPFFTGRLPAIHGVKFGMSTNSRVFSSAGLSGADIQGTLIWGKEAFGITSYDAHPARIMVVPRTMPDKTDPLQQYGLVGWKMSYQCVRLNENFAVRIEHTTTSSTAA
jgi:N4-gp56 family major capsid protein